MLFVYLLCSIISYMYLLVLLLCIVVLHFLFLWSCKLCKRLLQLFRYHAKIKKCSYYYHYYVTWTFESLGNISIIIITNITIIVNSNSFVYRRMVRATETAEPSGSIKCWEFCEWLSNLSRRTRLHGARGLGQWNLEGNEGLGMW
jgi:hypothetical protein